MTEPILPLSEDDELMAAVARDSTAALEQLMTRWQPGVYRFVYRGVRNAEVAEELTQETFWRLWRAREQYKPGGKFSAWLLRIASRLILDYYRKQARRPQLYGNEAIGEIVPTTVDRPDQAARGSQLKEALEAAIERLPVNQRLALQMNRFKAMSYREIAEALDCSVGSVEQLIYRARKKLRNELSEYLPRDQRSEDEKGAR